MKKKRTELNVRSFHHARVKYDKGVVTVPVSTSFRFSVCECEPPCGNVNFVFEDEDIKPFACAQFSYEQILGPLTECALEAKKLVGEKTH